MKQKHALLTALALTLPLASAQAATYTWTGVVSTNWQDAQNWNPTKVPLSSDHIVIDSGIAYPPNEAFGNLELRGGALAGEFAVGGIMRWSGGSLQTGIATVSPTGTLFIESTNAKVISALLLRNQGSVIWQDTGMLRTYAGSAVFNELGAQFDIRNNEPLTPYSGSPLIFTNAGTLRKSFSAGPTTFTASLVNNGAVDVQTGTLTLTAGGTLRGAVTADMSAAVSLESGQFALDGPVILDRVVLTNSALLTGTGVISGTLTWGAGTMANGVTTLATNCTLLIPGSGVKDLSSHTLRNYGWVIWEGTGAIRTLGGPWIQNEPGATFEMRHDAAIRWMNGGAPSFVNAGVLRKSAGINASTFDATFHHAGLVDVQMGALVLNNGGTLASALEASDGAEVVLAAGEFALAGSVIGVNVRFAGGAFTGTHTLSGRWFWTGGEIRNGVTTLATNCTFTVLYPGDKPLTSHTLLNQGWFIWDGQGALVGYGQAAIGNDSDGTFEMRGDGVLRPGGGSTLTLTNTGTLLKSLGTNGVDCWAILHSSGVVDVRKGALRLNNGGSLGGALIASDGAEVVLNAGQFALSGPVVGVNARFAGGAITGTHTLSGRWFWTGGEIRNGVTTLATNCTFTVLYPGDKPLTSHTLLNQGWFIWDGQGALVGYGQAAIGNDSDALFEMRGDGVLRPGGWSTLTVTNHGRLLKSVGTNATPCYAALHSTGLVDVKAGGLNLYAGGSLSGALRAVTNALLALGSGDFELTGPLLMENVELAASSFRIHGLVTATQVRLTGGNIFGTNSWSGTLDWTGGGWANGLATLLTNCTLTLRGAGLKDLTAHTLHNQGWIIWEGTGAIRSYNGATFVNDRDATFEVRGDAGFYPQSGAAPVFANAGTLRKTAGTNNSFTVVLQNSGTVDASEGTLAWHAGGSLAGALRAATNGANIVLAAGAFNADGPLFLDRVELAGATLTGTPELSGHLFWTSGVMLNGQTTVTTNGTLSLQGSGFKDLYAHTLRNQGWVVWEGSGAIRSFGAATFINDSGATFEARGDAALYPQSGYAPTFLNAGTWLKSGGTNTTLTAVLHNTDEVQVISGTLLLNAGGTLAGVLQATNGANIVLAAGTFNASGPVFLDQVELAGATLTGTPELSGHLFWTSGVMLNGQTTVTTNGTLSLQGAGFKDLYAHTLRNQGWVVWEGSGAIRSYGGATFLNDPGAVFQVRGDAALYAQSGYAPTFLNAGTLLKSGGTNTTFSAVLHNADEVQVLSGTLLLNAGGTLAGVMQATNGANIVLAAGMFNASGPVFLDRVELAGATLTGTLELSGHLFWTSGAMVNGLTTVTTNGTLTLQGSGFKDLYAHTLRNQGAVVWEGSGAIRSFGAATFVNDPGATFEARSDAALYPQSGYGPMFINKGILTKSGGTNTTLLYAVLHNSGTVEVQAGSLQLLDNGFPTNPNGTYSFLLGGYVAGAGFGRIVVPGAAALNGTLNVRLRPGFQPMPGSQFPVVSAGSRSGAFTLGQGFDLGNGRCFDPQYSLTGLTLVVTNLPSTNPPAGVFSISTPPGGGIQLSLGPCSGLTRMIETSTNLTEWSDLPPAIPCTNHTVTVSLPSAGEPGRFYRVRAN